MVEIEEEMLKARAYIEDEVNNPRQRTTAKSIYQWCYEKTGMRVDEKITWNGAA